MFVDLLAAILASATVQSQPQIILPAGQDDRARQEQRKAGSSSPEEWAAKCDDWDDWDKPAPPFLVHPRVHYVGTCGISALLVVTRSGNVLIDAGTNEGADIVLANIDRSMVEREWIRLILTSHEHFDHVGGLAKIQDATGAPALATPIGARVLKTGIVDDEDPQHGMHEAMEPARAIVPIEVGKPVTFGDVEFMPVSTPGHTPGALSWQWKICGDRSYEPVSEPNECTSIVYADSLSPVSRDDFRFADRPEYVASYRAGLDRLRGLECDILLTPHPSASKMIQRAASGSMRGGMTCIEYADAVEARLDERLAKEAAE